MDNWARTIQGSGGYPGGPGTPFPYSERFSLQLTADQNLYVGGELASGWNVIITVPENQTFVATHVWIYHDDGSAVTVRLRYTPEGQTPGDAFVYYEQSISATDKWDEVNSHKVLAAGSELAVYCGTAGVVNIQVDGVRLETQ